MCEATSGCGARSKRTETGCADEGGEGVTEDAQASASEADIGQCRSWTQSGSEKGRIREGSTEES